MEAHLAALRRELDLDPVTPDERYHALDWLQRQQPAIEKRLADRHLENGCLVLYDVTSTYFEGSCCPLATSGYSRDRKKGKRQGVFVGDRGLLTSARIREDCQGLEGPDWISARVKPDLARREASPGFQCSLLDERDMVEITDR